MKSSFLILPFLFLTAMVAAQNNEFTLPIKHSSFLSKAILSLNKNYIYTASLDNTIKVWNISNGNLITTFSGHENKIKDLTINNANTLLFSVDEAGFIFIWNIQTGSIEKKLIIETSNILTIYWDEKAKQLWVSTDDGKITWYQYPEMTKTKTISTSPYAAIKILKAKTPDLYYFGFKKCPLCTKNDISKGNVQMYDETTGVFFPICTYTDDLNDLYLSPDSTKLVSASAENYMVRLWDTERLLEDASIKNLAKPASMFMSKSNTMLGICSAENGEIHIHRNTGEEILASKIDSGKIILGTISDDLNSLYLLDNYGKFRKYDFSFKFKGFIGNYSLVNDEINTVAYSPKFKAIFLGLKNGKTKIFNLNDHKITFLPDSFNMQVNQIRIDSNWATIVYEPYISYHENDGSTITWSKLTLFDISKNQAIKTFTFNNKYVTSTDISENLLFIGYNNGLVEIYKIPDLKKLYSFQNAPFDILQIYFYKKNKQLFIQNIDQKVIIYNYQSPNMLKVEKTINLKTNEDILELFDGNIITNQQMILKDSCIKYSANQALWVNSNNVWMNIYDNLVKINIHQKQEIWKNKPDFPHPYFMLADSSLHRFFLIGKYGIIQVLDTDSGKKLCQIYFNNNAWICVSENKFDADSNIYSLNNIRTVKLNNLTLEREEGLLHKLLFNTN